MYFETEDSKDKCTTETRGLIWGIMDIQIERSYGNMFLYMKTATKHLYAQKCMNTYTE